MLKSNRGECMEDVIFNPKVNKLHFTGTLQEVFDQIKLFEKHFKLEPITSPNIPNQFALVNTFDSKPSFYAFVSRHYEVLEAWKSLELFIKNMLEELDKANVKEENLLSKFTAKAYISRNISVELYYENAYNDKKPLKLFHYVNSYDKKLKETIIFAPFMLSFSYVHRKSGLEKNGFTKLLELLTMQNYQGASKRIESTVAEKFIINTPVTLKEFEKLLALTQIPINKLLAEVFNMNKEEIKDLKDKNLYKIAYVEFSKMNDGPTLANLIQFVDKLYSVLSRNNKFDKASFIYVKVSNFITKKFINSELSTMI